MKLKFPGLIPVAALLCLVLASCKKNEVTSSASSQTSQLTKATSMIGAMESETDIEISAAISDEINTDAPACCTVTYSPSKNVYPHLKVFDYGSGCTDGSGITRSGKRFVTVYADQSTAPAGKVISVTTFSNYYVDGVNITGSVKLSVDAAAIPGPLVLRAVEDKVITDASGNTTSYVSKSIRKQIGGSSTSETWDDVYQITTNAYGTELDGDSSMVVWKYNSDPSNVIVKHIDCGFRSQGGIQINLKQLGVSTNEYLDYGNGDCDNAATLSVNNGTPESITLPFYFFAIKL